MSRRSRFSPEFRERAVGLVLEQRESYDSEWAAITAIAEKVGCHRETLRTWVRKIEVDTGRKPGITSDERERIKELEREVKELRRANKILHQASTYFAAAEFDRQLK
jgi:transposase